MKSKGSQESVTKRSTLEAGVPFVCSGAFGTAWASTKPTWATTFSGFSAIAGTLEATAEEVEGSADTPTTSVIYFSGYWLIA